MSVDGAGGGSQTLAASTESSSASRPRGVSALLSLDGADEIVVIRSLGQSAE